MARAFLPFILMVCLAYNAAALGISYHRSVNFEPSLEATYPVCVRNSHNVYFPVTLTVSDQLAPYMTLKDSSLTLGPMESRCTEYKVKLPEKLEVYGQVTGRIVASQVVDPYEQGRFAVQENIVHKFHVFVPYPGKYVVMEITGENANVNEQVQFIITASNMGSERIESAKASVKIWGADNFSNFVTTVETKEKPINSMETIKLYTFLDTVGLKPGVYKADAYLEYEDGLVRDDTTFNIGTLDVIIYGYTKNLTRGRINKFDILVSSAWNNRIEGIHAETSLPTVNSDVMVTPTAVLEPWTNITLTGYINVPATVQSMEHDGIIRLIYQNTSVKNIVVNIEAEQQPDKVEEQAEIEIPKNEGVFTLTNILILLVILFILFDIYLIFRKRKKRTKKMPPGRGQRRLPPVLVLSAPAVVVLGILAALWFYYSFIVVEIRQVPMDFRVAGSVGINADTDGLHFGKTSPGGSSMRMMRVTNNRDYPVKVRIANRGNFTAWLNLSDNDFVLFPGENASVRYTIEVPWEAPYGMYNGTSTFIIKRA